MPTAAERKRQEERVKLFATAVSNVGVATIVTGVVVPVLAGRASVLALVAFGVGLGLHLAAQVVLHLVAASPEQSDEQLD